MNGSHRQDSKIFNAFDSSEADWIDRLDPSTQDRVIAILDSYMVDLENGRQPSLESIVAEYPELEEPLRASLESIRLLHKVNANPDDSKGNRQGSDLIRPLSREISGYQIGRELGRGAMGVVYAAHCEATGEEVAIKFLESHGIRDQGSIERFRREARAAESLNDPNIVPVYQIGSEHGRHYYTMKLIDGASLNHTIDTAFHRNGNTNQSADLSISQEYYQHLAEEMAHVAEALHAAHTMGVVHRDIKPSNLLMDSSGRIWITDFGLAHVDDGLALTYSGDIIGTFQYMSPEQASGKRERIDIRSDIYSFGATLYELFTGHPPYSGMDRAEILQRIQSAEPLRPRAYNHNLPRDLETIIRRAMRPDRSDRYQSAELVAEDLHRFASGRPILANRVGFREQARCWATANAGRLAVALLIALFGVAGLSLFNFQIERQRRIIDDALRTAQFHEREARNVVDSLGSEFTKELSEFSDVPEALLKKMLNKTLDYYESFIASANKDPRLISDVAKTKLKIAQLLRSADKRNLNFEKTNDAYEKAVESLRIAYQDRNTVGIAPTFHLAINEWAMLRSDQGDQSSSIRLLEEAKSVAESIPQGVELAQAEALLHHTRAIVAFRSKNIELAISESSRAITILEKLEDAPDFGNLADALINLSAMLGEAGKNELADKAAQKALVLRKKILEQSETPETIKRMALACNNSASVMWRSGKTKEAIEAYNQAIGYFDRVSELVPAAKSPQRELSITLNNLGMAYASLDQFDDADAVFRRAIRIATTAADSDASNAGASQRAAGMWNNLGVLMKNKGRKALAADAFRKASEYQQRVCKLLPGHPNESSVLSQIQANLSSL